MIRKEAGGGFTSGLNMSPGAELMLLEMNVRNEGETFCRTQ